MIIPVPDLLAAWRDLARGRDELPAIVREAIAGKRAIKVPYLNNRPGANGPLRYWTPSPALRGAGWRERRLPDNLALAVIDALESHAELETWRAHGQPAGIGATRTAAQRGTFDELVVRYKSSRFYKDLTPRGREDYDYRLRELAKTFGPSPVQLINPYRAEKYVAAMAKHYPRKAAALAAMGHRLFKLAPKLYDPVREPVALPPVNPFASPGISNRRQSEPELWPERAVEIFAQAADALGWHSIGTAVIVNEWAGQNRGDVLSLPASAHGDGAFYAHRHKTGEPFALPLDMVPRLKRRLEEERERQRKAELTATTLIVCETTGRPWTGDYFNQVFRDVRAKAVELHPEPLPIDPEYPHLGEVQISDLVFRTLRHTACTRYLIGGCTAEQAAVVLGWRLKSVYDVIDRYNLRAPAIARTAFAQRLAHMDERKKAKKSEDG